MGGSRDYPEADDRTQDVPVPAIAAASGETYCQGVVTYLQGVKTTTVEDVAAAVTDWMNTRRSNGANPDDVEATAIALYHLHLPRLDAANIVEFDAEEQSVSIREGAATEMFVEMMHALDHGGLDIEFE